MLKDIEFKKVEDVAIAIIPDDPSDIATIWSAYFINVGKKNMYGVIVHSKGYGEKDGETKKTSQLRWFLDEVKPHSFKKIEELTPELTGFTNEFWVSYYIDGQIYDKKYVFVIESLTSQNLTNIPFLEKSGVMIK